MSAPAAADGRAALKRSRLFAGFSDTGLSILGAIAQRRALPAGTALFHQDDPAAALFVIGRGAVRVVARDAEGNDLSVATLGPGETLGAVSLLRGGKRMVSAFADTDCELWVIAQKDFARLQKEKPQACLKLMLNVVEDLGQRLDGASEVFREFLAWRLMR